MSMTAQKFGVSITRYVTTRTRAQFMTESSGVVSSIILPISVIGEALSENGDSPGDAIPSPPKDESDDIRAPNASSEMRAVKSRTVYPWYRRGSGRNYKVHNLDTRSPSEFRATTKLLGNSLAIKTSA